MKTVKLGEIATIYNGNSINKSVKQQKYMNDIPGWNYIGTKDIDFSGNITYKTGVVIPYSEDGFRRAPAGSVFVCSEGGSAGKKTAIVNEEVCFGNKLFAIVNDKGLFDERYLFYYTRYEKFREQFRLLATSLMGGISVRNFSSIEIPMTDRKTQEQIVSYIEELLSSLDKSVETLKKTQQQLAVYRQAVIEATIAEGKRNTDCVHLFSDFVKKYQNGISKRKGVGVPTTVLRLADIENQNIKNNGDFRTIDLSENEREKYLINEQELLIIRVNGSAENVGRIIVVSEDKKYTVCDHFIRCTLDDTRILPEYVKLHFNSMQTRKFINSNMVSTAGQNTISQTTLNNIQLFVPNIEKQQQLLEMAEGRLSICNSIEKTVDSALKKAEALRQSILKQAFEGDV